MEEWNYSIADDVVKELLLSDYLCQANKQVFHDKIFL